MGYGLLVAELYLIHFRPKFTSYIDLFGGWVISNAVGDIGSRINRFYPVPHFSKISFCYYKTAGRVNLLAHEHFDGNGLLRSRSAD